MEEQHIYIAIDLKSFYASVECVERKLDPLTTHLVVADASRTEKTICLAVSPSLKAYGIPGRARLFEVVQRIRQVNRERVRKAPGQKFTGTSHLIEELNQHPELGVDYIVAPPRMAFYMDYSTRIYDVYLRYVAPEDIHVYSIDEVFMDVTHYLKTYQMTAKQLASKIIMEIYRDTGITATGGIGTNLYLCKVAMDIMAKHAYPDENDVRIAFLDEMTYRKYLWDHRPLTDFWRVGHGYAKKLQEMGARNVLVSRSKDGATLVDEFGEVHSMGNVPGKVLNPVGCGDSMVAGFVAGYSKTHDYKYALKLGSACGNATAFCPGLADKDTIDKMLESEYLK